MQDPAYVKHKQVVMCREECAARREMTTIPLNASRASGVIINTSPRGLTLALASSEAPKSQSQVTAARLFPDAPHTQSWVAPLH